MNNRTGARVAISLCALLTAATSAQAGEESHLSKSVKAAKSHLSNSVKAVESGVSKSVQAAKTDLSKLLEFARGNKVEANSYPWAVVGKLNNGVGGSCTAVLISPHHALTAAHCLYLANRGQFLPAQSFHLLFGYQNQKTESQYLISAYYVPPTYQPLKPYETLTSDWALLSISPQQGPTAIRALDVDENPAVTSTLMTGGYSLHTPYAMTGDAHCKLVGRSVDGSLMYDSCKAPAGYSGAPVFAENTDNHSYTLAGIHVANQVFKTNAIAIAISMKTIWNEIKPCVENNDCQYQHVATGRDPTAAEVLSGLPNLGNQRQVELTSSTSCKDTAKASC